MQEGSRFCGVAYAYANLLGNEAGRAIYEGDEMIDGDIALFRRLVEDAVNFQAGIDQLTDRLWVGGDLPTDKIGPGDWRRLNLVWVVFFAAMGIANIYVAYNYSEKFWVNFKVFGLLALTFVFMLAQGVWLVSKLGGDEAAADTGEAE